MALIFPMSETLLMKHKILILFALLGLLGKAVSAAEPRVEFFFEPGCEDCEQIEDKILPQLESRLGAAFQLVRVDIGVESNLVHLLQLEHQTGYAGPERAYLVFNGQHAFGNPLNDPDAFFRKLKELLKVVPEPLPSADTDVDTVYNRFGTMTLPVVLLAGMLDGINPCAISTLIFFMSLLAVSRVRSRQLISLGVSFCLASFVTYFALGFGLLRFLHLFSGFTVLRSTVEWAMSGLLLAFAFLSFRDALRFRKSGDGKDVSLQLSVGMKKRIHSVMRRGLKTRHLILGGLMIGIAVTALESVCTGQMYVPTLVLILKKSNPFESRAWFYLLAYNSLFVLPLVVIFVAFYFGLKTETLLRWSRKNVVFSKTLIGLFFIAMALLFLLF
jgi:cytochrome c biogenesis protein CcdA